MTTSLQQYVINKSTASSFLTFLLPTSQIIQFSSSWFWITNTALKWFKTYVSSRSFSFFAFGFISPHSLSCGVPQDSVHDLILFNMYTTSFNTLISSRPLNHRLYTNDTQIFISFTPKTYIITISQLQDKIADNSSWMTSNFYLSTHQKLNLCSLIFLKKYSKSPTLLSLPSNHYNH